MWRRRKGRHLSRKFWLLPSFVIWDKFFTFSKTQFPSWITRNLHVCKKNHFPLLSVISNLQGLQELPPNQNQGTRRVSYRQHMVFHQYKFPLSDIKKKELFHKDPSFLQAVSKGHMQVNIHLTKEYWHSVGLKFFVLFQNEVVSPCFHPVLVCLGCGLYG